MAVNITAKDPNQVLEAFGLSADHIGQMISKGLKVEVTSSAIVLKCGVNSESVQVKSGAVSMALSGKLGPASKQSVGYKLVKAMKKVMENAGVVDLGAENKPKTKKPKEEPKTFSEHFSDAVVETPPQTPDELKSLLSEQPVKLTEATALYQPVKGTSASSVYHVIGITEKVVIAARYKNTTLSLRAEGDVHTCKQNLENAGFSMSNIKNDYVSVHMDVKDDILAAKTLGAVLGGLGMQLLTLVPNLFVIKNVGA